MLDDNVILYKSDKKIEVNILLINWITIKLHNFYIKTKPFLYNLIFLTSSNNNLKITKFSEQ